MSNYRNFQSVCDMQEACGDVDTSSVPGFVGVCDMLAACEETPPPSQPGFFGVCEMTDENCLIPTIDIEMEVVFPHADFEATAVIELTQGGTPIGSDAGQPVAWNNGSPAVTLVANSLDSFDGARLTYARSTELGYPDVAIQTLASYDSTEIPGGTRVRITFVQIPHDPPDDIAGQPDDFSFVEGEDAVVLATDLVARLGIDPDETWFFMLASEPVDASFTNGVGTLRAATPVGTLLKAVTNEYIQFDSDSLESGEDQPAAVLVLYDEVGYPAATLVAVELSAEEAGVEFDEFDPITVSVNDAVQEDAITGAGVVMEAPAGFTGADIYSALSGYSDPDNDDPVIEFWQAVTGGLQILINGDSPAEGQVIAPDDVIWWQFTPFDEDDLMSLVNGELIIMELRVRDAAPGNYATGDNNLYWQLPFSLPPGSGYLAAFDMRSPGVVLDTDKIELWPELSGVAGNNLQDFTSNANRPSIGYFGPQNVPYCDLAGGGTPGRLQSPTDLNLTGQSLVTIYALLLLDPTQDEDCFLSLGNTADDPRVQVNSAGNSATFINPLMFGSEDVLGDGNPHLFAQAVKASAVAGALVKLDGATVSPPGNAAIGDQTAFFNSSFSIRRFTLGYNSSPVTSKCKVFAWCIFTGKHTPSEMAAVDAYYRRMLPSVRNSWMQGGGIHVTFASDSIFTPTGGGAGAGLEDTIPNKVKEFSGGQVTAYHMGARVGANLTTLESRMTNAGEFDVVWANVDGSTRVLVIMEYYNSSGETAAQILAHYAAIAAQGRLKGAQYVVMCNPIPYTGHNATKTNDIIAGIAAGVGTDYDAQVTWSAGLLDPSDTTKFNVDGVHLKPAGWAIAGQDIWDVIDVAVNGP